MNSYRWPPILAVLSTIAAAAGGCAESNNEPTMEQRQNAALNDPFSYGNPAPPPGLPARPTPQPAIPPKDDSLKGEWDRFWNP